MFHFLSCDSWIEAIQLVASVLALVTAIVSYCNSAEDHKDPDN